MFDLKILISLTVFHRHGGLQLVMPLLKNGQKLEKSQYLALFVTLLKSALSILRDEQFRTSDGGKEESDALIVQMIRYCYNQEPFGSRIWDATMKPLDFWTTLTNDSNAQQLAVSVISTFTILSDLIHIIAHCCQVILHLTLGNM